jgi:nitrogen regulatory protein PII
MSEMANSLLKTVQKVDIIVSHSFLQETLKILDTIGVSGYTVFGSTSGKGDRGVSCDDFDCDYSGSYIMTVCNDEEQLNQLVNEIRPLLKKSGGIFVVTESRWLDH